MHRFYVPGEITGNAASITDLEQLHHLRDVLRLRAGDQVTVFDSEGNEYSCTIRGLDKKEALLAVRSRRPAKTQKVVVAIACAIPKKSGMDDIIDKLTQLGVDTIIPLETERGIVKPDQDLEKRLERWRKIARNAAEQSRRSTLPSIPTIRGLKEVLARSPDYDLKLVLTLAGERATLKEILSGTIPGRILVLIGPEGDFTPSEIQLAIEAGFVPVSLGGLVLRVETAAIAVASFISLEREQ